MSEPARVRVVETARPVAQTSAEFVGGFVPPDYVLDGVLQRGFLYSNTGQTGAGKTAIMLRIMAHAALGLRIGHREIAKCRVLMLVGENADDVRARWIAYGEHMGFVPGEIDVYFMPGIFSIPEALEDIRALAAELGGFHLIVVDTSAAYFQGDDENSNPQSGGHARELRALTLIDGRPCVVANCHPTKNSTEENLLPRGGGAFLAEVDGNLTCAKKDGAVQMHWQGKFRGPEFEPMAFDLQTVTSDFLRDTRGRHVPTVIARILSEAELTTRANAANDDLLTLIEIMQANTGASMAVLAERAGWSDANHQPAKSKVQRLMKELDKGKLAEKVMNTWTLTTKGQKAAKSRAE